MVKQNREMYFRASQRYFKTSPSGLNFPSWPGPGSQPNTALVLGVKALSGSAAGFRAAQLPLQNLFGGNLLSLTQGTLDQRAASAFWGQHSCPLVTVSQQLTVSSPCHLSTGSCRYKDDFDEVITESEAMLLCEIPCSC